MKTQQTKDMEQALIRDALRKGKHPALEVPYAHTIDIGHETYWPEGQWEYIDAVLKRKDNNDIGLIVENDMHEYCLINITTNFIFINRYGNIADLQKDNREYWHKLNAKLVIE